MLEATLEGVGFWANGLPDWDSACAWMRKGERPQEPPARPVWRTRLELERTWDAASAGLGLLRRRIAQHDPSDALGDVADGGDGHLRDMGHLEARVHRRQRTRQVTVAGHRQRGASDPGDEGQQGAQGRHRSPDTNHASLPGPTAGTDGVHKWR